MNLDNILSASGAVSSHLAEEKQPDDQQYAQVALVKSMALEWLGVDSALYGKLTEERALTLIYMRQEVEKDPNQYLEHDEETGSMTLNGPQKKIAQERLQEFEARVEKACELYLGARQKSR